MAYQCPMKYLNNVFEITGDECTHENKSDDCDDNGQEPCDYCLAASAYNDAFDTMRNAMNEIEKRKQA